MQFATGLIGKAPLVGAFFVFALCAGTLNAANCDAPQDAHTVKVRHVHDGDTLVLTDNRRVRIIGINTPEVGKDGTPAEPLALRARDQLRRLVFQNRQQVRLLAGTEAKDRHGRWLANLWLGDGRNIAAHLLEQGLGWYVAVPPNIRFVDCYRQAEREARQAGRGVWESGAFEVRDSDSLKLRDRGFHIVRGTVVRVNRGGGATWMNLKGRLAIRIPDHALQWFPKAPDRQWLGREVEVRGWLYKTKGELRVNVGHPAAIRTLSPAL